MKDIMDSFFNKLHQINCFIFDVDGVLTDGSLLVTESGELLRTMNIKDGYALQLAIKKGFKVAIISGGKSEGVIKRLNKLGITDVFMGVEDKLTVLHSFLSGQKIKPETVLYMGDDMPDLKPMQEVLLPVCPMDAIPEILAISAYQSPYKGGQGCVRDVIEKVLKINDFWL